ncbi:MAG: hypothetical protein L3J14_05720 [Flavobacteriaceae bacterium]|nr:hypothetical protein [Flavobacteriaceae bacterium]
MKNFINNNAKNTSNFTVAINHVNNSKTLLPYVLYQKMEEFVLKSTNPFEHIIISKPALKKLNILKNAFLNDKLQLSSYIKTLEENELQLVVEVCKSNSSREIICNAFFSFILKENGIKKVS